MKRFLGAILVIIFFIGCTKKLPEGIFNEKKMVNILYDIHLVDNYVSSSHSDTLPDLNYYESIYQKYDTDSAGLRKNIQYYSEHPQDLQDIYVEVSKRLRSVGDELTKHSQENQAKIVQADSVKRQRIVDSLNILKRDSILRFDMRRHLYRRPIDSMQDSIGPKDSVKYNNSWINQMQTIGEMTFYYFNNKKKLDLSKEGRGSIDKEGVRESELRLAPEKESTE